MIHSMFFLLAVAAATVPAPEPSPGRIEIPSALVRVIEQVDVPAREAGVLSAVNVREGQLVEPGELLAQIIDADARIAEARATIEVEIATHALENDVNLRYARKSVEVAGAELQRSEESIRKYSKSISDSEMDRLQLVVQRAELEVEQAEYDFEIAKLTRQLKENDLRSAEEQVAKRKIVASTGGVVVDVHRHRGEWVQPGDVVLRMVRIDRLRVDGFLGIQEATEDLQGADVRLLVDLPGQPGAEFPGKILFLSPEIDPVNSQVPIRAEIENRGLLLRPGMRARMIIEPPESTPAEDP